MSVALLAGFAAAAVRIATPLLLAALGETVAERGGVLNLGIEGAMLTGALAAALAGSVAGPWMGFGAGIAAGTAVAAVFSAVVIGAGADQVISGTAITLGAAGVTGAIYRALAATSPSALTSATFPAIHIPVVGDLPVLGAAFFDQPAPTYLGYLAIGMTWWLLYRTRWGLRVRAAGESLEGATAAGVDPTRVRLVATLIGGALAGAGGATLVLAQVGGFGENLTAGRGFVAIALVVLGRWDPVRVALAALAFGVLTALQFLLQGLGLAVPYQLFLMLPYVITLLALGGAVGRTRAPAALGR